MNIKHNLKILLPFILLLTISCNKDEEDPPVENKCSPANISYSSVIQPIIKENCNGCHKGVNSSSGIPLDSYINLKIAADNKSLQGSISWESGFNAMPLNKEKLSDCQISKIETRISQGAKDN